MFTLKNCLFGATNIVKGSDNEKYLYSGYGIVFGGKGEWSFNNYTAKNIITLGVGNSSSCHTHNLKNNFLILGEGSTFGINGSFGASEKKFSINFTKAKTKFSLSLRYNADNSYFPMGKYMFVEYSWTFPWDILGIFGNSSLWNSREYSQIMFREYWI